MRILQILLAFILCIAAPAWAEEMPMHVRGALVAVEGGAEIRLNLTEGWHTYGPEPGDAGLPPRFDWTASENIGDVEIIYPEAQRFEEAGFETFGYEDEVTFKAVFERQNPEKPAALHLKLDVMVCSDICIPQTLEMAVQVYK